jgi:hypothetical protein
VNADIAKDLRDHLPYVSMGRHGRSTDAHGMYSLLCEQGGDLLSRVKQIGWPGYCDRSSWARQEVCNLLLQTEGQADVIFTDNFSIRCRSSSFERLMHLLGCG